MSPILVPTLAELRTELERADALRIVACAQNDAAPQDTELQTRWEAALDHCCLIVAQIAKLPAASLADLRVKAYALDWSARTFNGEPYQQPDATEERLFQQLVAGLLDERIC